MQGVSGVSVNGRPVLKASSHSFRQIFFEILPLPQINREEFYTQSCPLLQSSILLFASRTDPGLAIFSQSQQRLISAITDRNMSSATSAKPTIARLIALLILSNLPPNPATERLQPAEYQTTPLVAFSMAQHLELDTALHILCEEDSASWSLFDVSTLLENLCLVSSHRIGPASFSADSEVSTVVWHRPSARLVSSSAQYGCDAQCLITNPRSA